MDIPQITLGSVNIESDDPQALAAFWAGVTGGTPQATADTVYLPAAGPGGFALFFRPLQEARPARCTIHLDLTVPWGARTGEVDRTVALGATKCWDVLDEHPHVRWTTMTDPEGNYFCLAEHPPSG